VAGAAGGAVALLGRLDRHLLQVVVAHEPDQNAVVTVVPRHTGHYRDELTGLAGAGGVLAIAGIAGFLGSLGGLGGLGALGDLGGHRTAGLGAAGLGAVGI